MEAARVEPERIDEGDIAFRLGPRLNAAGRLYRADAGVELMLTDDPCRATAIAAELDAANHERRETERQVANEAEAGLRGLPERAALGAGHRRRRRGLASRGRRDRRLAARRAARLPAIVLAVEADGRAEGSGAASRASTCSPRLTPAPITSIATAAIAPLPDSSCRRRGSMPSATP